MFSFGMLASLALRTAFSSVTFVSGSPPPSRAATVIERASFVNCWPLRESTIAFLCLMLAHFECPDMQHSLRSRRRSRTRRRPLPLGGGPPDGFDLRLRLQERVEQLRVEMVATRVPHHLDRHLDRKRGAVHTIA